ncbi:hypothetical protein KP509_13G013300 [Ceratopteris richardii]|nr:hypothetical protein KP509_13G013300 [Ceratopteris richardii]
MQYENGISPDKVSFLCILKTCCCLKAIQQGNLVFKQLIETDHIRSAPIQSSLILMYAKCDSLDDARRVFDIFPRCDVVLWGTMLAAYAHHGDGAAALDLYTKMYEQNIQPDKVTFLCLLKAVNTSKNSNLGRLVHNEIMNGVVELDAVLGSTLVDMYAKCGDMEDAQATFDDMPHRNAVTWNVMILGYVQHGHGYMALQLFSKMQYDNTMKPEKVTFVCALKACACIGAAIEGRMLHDQIIRRSLEEEDLLENTIIDMYAKCGMVDEAANVFSRVYKQEVVSWNSLMGAYTQQGQALEALKLFQSMQIVGVLPDTVTFSSILKACATTELLEFGQLIHDWIVQLSIEADVVIGSALIDMYCKCRHVNEGHKVFEKLHSANVVSWNAVISGYVQIQHDHKALELFQQMLHRGVDPNDVTYSSILKACSNLSNLEAARVAHDRVVRGGLEDAILVCALVDTYAKCGSIREAHWVFNRTSNHSTAAWAALIGGHVQNNKALCALELFERMEEEDIKPDKVTFLSALKAPTMLGAINEGMLLHDRLLRDGYGSDVALGNTLVDMYAKCGRLDDACRVFDRLTIKDVVSWGALITGYTQQDNGFAALELYQRMETEGNNPESATLLSLLKACGTVGAFEQGKIVHEKLVRQAFDDDSVVGNALVDMYAKCGRMRDAIEVMERLFHKDRISWNALISGYAMQGNFDCALLYLRDMQQHGLEPDSYSYTSIIDACSHAGDSHTCLALLRGMTKQHFMNLNLEEFNCIVDALGRSGLLDNAKELLQSLPCPPEDIGWMSLLTSFRTHGSLFVAVQSAHCDEDIEPDNMCMSKGYRMSSQETTHVQARVKRLEKALTKSQLNGNGYVGITSKFVKRWSVSQICTIKKQPGFQKHMPNIVNMDLGKHVNLFMRLFSSMRLIGSRFSRPSKLCTEHRKGSKFGLNRKNVCYLIYSEIKCILFCNQI